MRALVEKLQTTITDFVAQRDALWLLVAATAADAPIIFKLLQDCERSSKSEVFLIFGAAFVDAEQYAAAVVAQFCAEYQALSAARVARNQAPLGSLPDSLRDVCGQGVKTPPTQRIVAMIETARSLLPDEGIYRLVWAFWPLEVADPVAYEALLKSLISRSDDCGRGGTSAVPWQQSVRLLGRELQGFAPLPSEQYVLRADSDFSPAALLRSLQTTCDDVKKPEAVRMHALFTLATLEQAQDRLVTAVARYGRVLVYYQQQKNPNMQVVVLLQLGEAYQKLQRLSAARACYEQALTITSASAVPVPLCAARLARNLGEVAFAQQRYTDATTGYQTWHRIAGQLGDETGAAAARAKLAAVQERLGQTARHIHVPVQGPYFGAATP